MVSNRDPYETREDRGEEAGEILERMDDLWRGTSSQGRLSMKVVTNQWTRTLTMEIWTKGKDYSLVRILTPLKEKATATLKAKDEIWHWLPKVKRRMKVPSAMMASSWMGSHFTNDDLVKESRISQDYDPDVSFEGERDGEEIWEFTLYPKPDAPVVWGKVLVIVRKRDLMPLTIDYFDEEGQRIRTLSCHNFQEMGGRLLPSRLRMTPHDKEGEYTEVVYESITFDKELDESFFSLQNLSRE
jgi:outer membrane lipoprotein-sorting protein